MERWALQNGIYQIYPRSYRDTNGDGVGDLPGVTEMLGYLKGNAESLGVDAIWISPFYPSPMKDFGYDVSNFCEVDPIFGTLADFDELIKVAHERGISVMVDFVPNHTSSEHPWFIDALSSKDANKRDYYIFRDPKEDGSEPNNWQSVFGGPAWTYDEASGQYYLHSFLKEQPDLNWENPAVQEEMRNVVRFWFERGVDGLRVDAVRWMGKNTNLLDDPINDSYHEGQDPYHAVEHRYSRYSPELTGYLRVITDVAEEFKDRIIVFEDHLDRLTPEESQIRRIYGIDPEVSAPFNFQGMHIGFGSRSFSYMVNSYQGIVPMGARAFYCFSNHDESRVATRFGEKEARMLAVLQLSLPGTPVIYYGQELGMTDVAITPEQVQDPFEKRVPGKGLGRDPERSPMQWSDAPLAGFTHADKSWLPIADTYETVNVAAQQTDKTSSLNLYRQLLALRSKHETLRNGNYEHGHTDDQVFMFWRHGETDRFLSILNFSNEEKEVAMPGGGEIVASAQNYQLQGTQSPGRMQLAPLEGLLIRYII